MSRLLGGHHEDRRAFASWRRSGTTAAAVLVAAPNLINCIQTFSETAAELGHDLCRVCREPSNLLKRLLLKLLFVNIITPSSRSCARTVPAQAE